MTHHMRLRAMLLHGRNLTQVRQSPDTLWYLSIAAVSANLETGSYTYFLISFVVDVLYCIEAGRVGISSNVGSC